MKQKIIIFLMLLSTSICCAQNKKENNTYPVRYKSGKRFIYQAKYDSAGTVSNNYIVMRILSKEMYRQTAITYDYYNEKPEKETMDSLSSYTSRGFLETTEILDIGNYIWIHPPRTMYNRLTQYFPFPEISLPLKIGKSYKRGFLSFNDPLCHCTLWLKFRMQILAHTQHLYQNKLIDACLITGYANSKYGYFEVRYLFNEQLGFVKWVYKKDSISLELNLIDQF